MACSLASAEPELWSLGPLVSGEAPEVKNEDWVKTSVDRFILAKLDTHHLSPQAEADRYTLIRRATVGLTGLPPTVEEIEQFVSNKSPEAYEELVTRLLASPHYGERWGRHWLDVVRFGESDGVLTVNEDKVRKDAWRFRDSVIHALNNDLPFDRFVRYQISGPDGAEAKGGDYDALRQFIHLGTRLQNNSDPNDKQFHRLDDMVSTTGTAFLGLTFGCARCHDHPVDPMSTEEYYQFTAFFFDQFKEAPKASAKKIALAITEPRVLIKGSWSTPGKAVDPGFLKVLMKKGGKHWRVESRSELEALGYWMTDENHGAGQLLARVIVNRLWHHHFGRGLVKTSNDFGKLGSLPSHPRLLDHLARQFIAGGWKLKPIHRLIMSSAVYRQSGTTDTAPLQIDAENALLWHRRPQRLESEAIRDHLLSVAGVLGNEMYGPSISIGDFKKEVQDDPRSWRRSIYLQVHRSAKHPTLSLFDPPDTERSVGARSTGAAPEGALFALNAPLGWTLAEKFAERVKREVGEDSAKRVHRAYLLLLSRPPFPEERAIGLEFLAMGGEGTLVEYSHLLLGLNEFIYVN